MTMAKLDMVSVGGNCQCVLANRFQSHLLDLCLNQFHHQLLSQCLDQSRNLLKSENHDLLNQKNQDLPKPQPESHLNPPPQNHEDAEVDTDHVFVRPRDIRLKFKK